MNNLNLGAKIGITIGLVCGIIGLTVAIITSPLYGSIFALFFIILFGNIYWFVFRPIFKSFSIDKELQEHGLKAEATIIGIRDTGVSFNYNPQAELTLEVSPPHMPKFQAKVKKVIPRLQISTFQPGMKLNVLFDPNNPTRVSIVDA